MSPIDGVWKLYNPVFRRVAGSYMEFIHRGFNGHTELTKLNYNQTHHKKLVENDNLNNNKWWDLENEIHEMEKISVSIRNQIYTVYLKKD